MSKHHDVLSFLNLFLDLWSQEMEKRHNSKRLEAHNPQTLKIYNFSWKGTKLHPSNENPKIILTLNNPAFQ